MQLHVGTSGFAYKEWKGSFYPLRMSDKVMLNFYGEHFSAVEINYTFRSTPSEDLLQRWADAVPTTFRFALKAPWRITHIQRLKNARVLMADFFNLALVLGENLGPLFVQLPPNLKKDVALLHAFLDTIPVGCRVAMEFRHQSWFDDDVFALLLEYSVAMCLAEADNELQVPFLATTDWGYVRLRRYDYTDAELVAWLKRIREQSWSEVFVFFKHEDEGRGPIMARGMLALAHS